VVSPKGVVMENIARVPPSSLKRSMSLIMVPPRSSSRRKVRSMSSTSKTTVPTPSGCLRRKRQARPPSPAGAQTTKVTSPAWKTAEVCRPRSVSCGPDTPVSAKSSRSSMKPRTRARSWT
jgi:hypothetical protein